MRKFKGRCNKGNYCGVRVHRTAKCKLASQLSPADLKQMNMKKEMEFLRIERELEEKNEKIRIRSDFLDLPYRIYWKESKVPLQVIVDGSMEELQVLRETVVLENGMTIERKSLIDEDKDFYWYKIWDCKLVDTDASLWVDYYMDNKNIDESKRSSITEAFENEFEYITKSLEFEYSESGGHLPVEGLVLKNPEVLYDLDKEISNLL